MVYGGGGLLSRELGVEHWCARPSLLSATIQSKPAIDPKLDRAGDLGRVLATGPAEMPLTVAVEARRSRSGSAAMIRCGATSPYVDPVSLLWNDPGIHHASMDRSNGDHPSYPSFWKSA